MSAATAVQVVGAGGHGKVVIATLQAAGFEVVGVFDDAFDGGERHILGAPVLGRATDLARGVPAVLAVGDNRARAALAARLEATWVSAVHPRAWVHPSVRLGHGTVVFAGAVIQPEASLGRHSIVNTCASIDHDCQLGDFVHIAPGCHLSGGVRCGEGALLGVGSCARPGASVGAWTAVGAGAAVVGELPDEVVAVGVPARVVARGGSGASG